MALLIDQLLQRRFRKGSCMARIVIEYPDELTELTIDAFWALYGGGGAASLEDKRTFCHSTIRKMIAEEVGKYVRQRELMAATVAAKEAGDQIVSRAETAVKITAESAAVS
jgi:hypothetical protein